MAKYILNRGTFLIPSVPDTFTDVSEAQKTIVQIVQTLSDIVRSLRLYPDVDTSWLTTNRTISDDKYIY